MGWISVETALPEEYHTVWISRPGLVPETGFLTPLRDWCSHRDKRVKDVTHWAAWVEGEHPPGTTPSLSSREQRLVEALRRVVSTRPGHLECNAFHHSAADRHGFADVYCPAKTRWDEAMDNADALLEEVTP